MESYYRSCRKVGGTIIKNRPARTDHENYLMWTVISGAASSPSLDGMYVLRVTLQAKAGLYCPGTQIVNSGPSCRFNRHLSDNFYIKLLEEAGESRLLDFLSVRLSAC
jgi:hypothetical protein